MKGFFQQVLTLWKQLGFNQRVSLGAAVAVVTMGMIGLLAWSHQPSMQLLYGKLGEKDASEVMAAVQAAGVKYEIGAGGSAIYVPADDVHKLRLTLAGKGIPSGEGVGFEVFDKPNFGISDFVQRTNYTRALQGELSRTISQLHGVRSSRVLIVMPENRLLFSDTKAKPTASVFIDGNITTDGVNSIRFLVANAVEGLRADDVAVVDARGNVLTEGLHEDPTLAGASSQMKLRKSVEDYLTNKVESMLAKVVGPGNSVVRVSAELENESTTRTEERYDPDGQVIRSDTSTEDNTLTNETDPAKSGETGAGANLPKKADAGADGKTGKNSEQTRKNKTLQYEINRITMNSVRAAGTVARISAAVFVAPKAQPRTPAEIESLRHVVVNALGIKAADDKELAKMVTVEESAFEPTPEIKTSMTELAYSFADFGKEAFAVIAAIALFVVFIRMIKKAKPDEIPMELLSAKPGLTDENGIRGANGPVTAEMLNELIRERPQNVGTALRNWMAAPNGANN